MKRAIVCAVALAGCGGDPPRGGTGGGASQAAVPTAEADAQALGREVFDLVDRAMSYRSSHRGRLPRSLRELGVDELTPETSRTYRTEGGVPRVTVSFRRSEGRILAACAGTSQVIEEAAMGGGEFTVTCNLVGGGTTVLKARR